ncbi:MAG: transposase family protein [Candidatus Poribacteria bacterium]|nr:transposase family protein [Candidatus Poribacteria bacterium]
MKKQPMKKYSRKSPLRLRERLLLTFTSPPHNPTFARLSSVFGLSESEANKIYHQILDLLLKVVPMKSRKHLLDGH